MKRIGLFGFLIFLKAISVSGQMPDSLANQVLQIPKDTSYWKKNCSLGLNFANVGLSNWAAGGVSSVSLNTLANLGSDYEHGTNSWTNRISFAYGLIRQGKNDQQFRKTDDNFLASTQYGSAFENNPDWKWIIGASLRTQVDAGFVFADNPSNPGQQTATRISGFMAPGYVLVNTGLSYSIADFFSVKISPLTYRLTIVNDELLSQAGAFKVDKGKKLRHQLGWSMSSRFEKEIFQNIKFQNMINLFGDYKRLDIIVVNWDTMLIMKINKYISSTFSTQLIYDHDVIIKRENGSVGPALQFKHALNVGILVQLLGKR